MSKEVAIGQLFQIDEFDGTTTRMVHNLTQGNDPHSPDFGAWYVRQNETDGQWEMYGFGGSVNVRDVDRWLPERLSVLEIARAAKAYGFNREMRRSMLQGYDQTRVFPD